tara:strand:- start:8234 stop:9634 length:1401 start_codon:yes stop_codon:yes gene_type:complete
MKKILFLLCISTISAFFAILVYSTYFVNNNQSENIAVKQPLSTYSVNYTPNYGNGGSNVDFTTAAEKSLHSVVHVKNTTTSTGYTSFEDLFFGRPQNRYQVGTGSGVIISPEGHIITNNHVIEGSESIEITTNNNKTYSATIIGTDPVTDIALLKIDSDDELNFMTFGDSNITKVGEWVLAVGNPFNLNSTVTAGIISAKSRDLSGDNTQSFIQTDAAVNPGNSGGALVNIYGDLIGINTAISSQTGSYIGYSFAVPSNIARKVVEDLMEFGTVQNGILGVVGTELNSQVSQELGINETEGFYVNEVQDGSGAKLSGIEKGDIIKSIDGINILKFSDLKGFLNTKSPNDIVKVKILRKNETKSLNVKLEKLTTIYIPIIGTLKEISSEKQKKLGISNGLELQSLSNKYKNEWMSDGVKEGSIILSINEIKVNTITDIQKALSKSNEKVYQVSIIKNNGEKMVYRFR